MIISYKSMTSEELSEALLDYSKARDGEIAELTREAGERIKKLLEIAIQLEYRLNKGK